MEFVSSCVRSFTSHFGTVIVGLVVMVVLYWYGTRKARKLESAFPGMPGPKPLPFLGNVLNLIAAKGQVHVHFDRFYKKYGRLFSVSFFEFPGLVIADPEMIKDILVKNFECFHDRPDLFTLPEPLDKSLSIVKGETWRRIRNTLSPTFSAFKLKGMIRLMNAACDILMKKAEEVAQTGGSFDIVRCQQGLTLDIIMSTMFGVQTDYQNNPDDPIMQRALAAMKPSAFMQVLANVVLPLLPFGRTFLTSKVGAKIFFKEMLDLKELAQDVVDMKRRGDSDRKDLLDLIVNAKSNDSTDKKKLTDDEIVAQCIIFLLAGYETSSTTLALVCYHLATNPQVQERLQSEIDSVWTDEDKMPSYETVHELPYLDMVISETLRLCPPGLVLMRQCNKECVIKGIKIPKGAVILIPSYSMHMDPSFFPDPEKFDPERFSDEAKQSRDPYVYQPFGHGPRNCIGMRFVQMEIKLVLARLLKKYTFVVTKDTKIPPTIEAKATLTVTSEITLGVRKRDQDNKTT